MPYNISQAINEKIYLDIQLLTKLQHQLSENLQHFAIKFYKISDSCDLKKKKYSDLTKVVQLVEDIKYLTKINELAAPIKEQEAILFDITQMAFYINAKDQTMVYGDIKKPEDSTKEASIDATIEYSQQFILNQIKQRVLAWNFSEQMQS